MKAAGSVIAWLAVLCLAGTLINAEDEPMSDSDRAYLRDEEGGFASCSRYRDLVFDFKQNVPTPANLLDAMHRTSRCYQKNMLVCKRCSVSGAKKVTLRKQMDEFVTWCFDSGEVTNAGDGGFENWMYHGCVSERSADGQNVKFFDTARCGHRSDITTR